MLMLMSLYPIQEVQLAQQSLNTFLAWPTHLVQHFSEQVFPFVVFFIIKKRFITNKVLIVIDLCVLTVQDKQEPEGLTKPINGSEPDDDPLYQMTIMIQQLFLKPMQVSWDSTVFGVYNDDVPLYIKYEDFSEIAQSGQCLNISIKQMWIL